MALSAEFTKRFRLSYDEQGCVVIDVNSGSLAERIRLMKGDLIRAVNQVTTPNTGQFNAVIKKLDLKNGVVFDINRHGEFLCLSYAAN